MSSKKRICILHGAINNSGDFLIYNRGLKLLSELLDCQNVDIVSVERWKPFGDTYDVLVILGGPIISKNLNNQVKNIDSYLNKRNIPVICIGIGISGDQSENCENFSLNCESMFFWKKIYDSSNLFSVRDLRTQMILKQYQINAKLTGCPAFFDLNFIDQKNRKHILSAPSSNIKRIAVTVPNLGIKSISNLTKSLFFLFYLYWKLRDSNYKYDVVVVFQHSIHSVFNKKLARFSNILGFEVLDASKRSLDEIELLKNSDIHIGTRLHANIFFLSVGKPSYLFDIDCRTAGFLSTVLTPSSKFTIIGIKTLLDILFSDLKNPEIFYQRRSLISEQISFYYSAMADFICVINEFIRKA